MTTTVQREGCAQPIVFDLYCGLGGWSEAFIAQGWRAVGFDIERHDYGTGGYPGELVLRDVRSITGKELVETYGVPNVIVASPPCQEFSYMAMPWSKAKEKLRKIAADPAEQKRLTDLFNQCFRIQREVSEAAGHYVPMIVENVRGAQRWVGRARWNFGSFYLWGDVPALMPAGSLGVKFSQSGDLWFDGVPRDKMLGNKGPAALGSKSKSRKAASAQIAKIPRPLADWIAKCFAQPLSPVTDFPGQRKPCRACWVYH